MKKVSVISFAVLFAMAGQATAVWYWPPTYTEIVPQNPTSFDIVAITLGGDWSDSCIPNASNVLVMGNDIYFDVILDYPPDIMCLTVITPWGLTESVGPLSPGAYTVYARIVGYPGVPEYEPVAEFIVTAAAATTTYQFQPDPNALRTSGGFTGQGKGSRSIEGRFQLTVDFNAGIASFDQVDATLSDEIWFLDYNEGPIYTDSLDVLFHMTELVSTDVNEKTIHFEIRRNNPTFPGADILVVVTYMNNSVHLTGGFCEAVYDGFCYHLDAVAILLPKTYYVDTVNGDDNNDGLSPETAFATIQKGIDDSNDGDIIEIQPGIYTGDGNRDIDFKGKAIIVRSTDPNDPCVAAATIINCQGSEVEPHRGFYFHSNEDSNSLIDGLTITNGFGNFETIGEYETPTGGGIYCYQSSPTIKNCIITGNLAYIYIPAGGGFHIGGFGGGIYCYQSNPKIKNCTIKNNKAGDGGYALGVGGLGGGIYGNQSSPIISNCTITNNRTEWLEYTYDWYPAGGGIYLFGGNPTITNCSINGNYCGYTGGGVCCYSSAEITNCDITNNETSGFGGGLEISNNTIIRNCKIINNETLIGGGGISGSSNLISNCVISQNTAWGDPELWGGIDAAGGGIYCDGTPTIINCTISGNNIGWGATGGIYCTGSPTINNCIVWGNDDAEISHGSPVVTYSDVQGGWAGEGNIDIDPCFADPYSGDYHLKSTAGRWNRNSQSWVTDAVTSPCIDAGDPNSDWTAELWPHGKRINMGAYGGTPQGSMSLSTVGNIANLDNDPCDIIDFNDLALFVGKWLYEEVLLPEDLDRNGIVNFVDYAIFARQWPGAIAEPIAEPGIEYEISPCEGMGLSATEQLDQTRFTVTVEGRYIHFEDMMTGNCCATELWLEMDVTGNIITIHERYYAEYPPCPCMCDYPVTATLGPFEPGTYTLEVYQGGFIGSTTVVIE
jgi:hypothetical protein